MFLTQFPQPELANIVGKIIESLWINISLIYNEKPSSLGKVHKA